MQYSSAFEKKAILPSATVWMNPEDIMRSEIGQTHSPVGAKVAELMETLGAMVVAGGDGVGEEWEEFG